MRVFFRFSVCAISFAWFATQAFAQPQYQIFDIGVVQKTDTASQGFNVSPHGVAVGRVFQNNASQAFGWTLGGGIVGLPNLAGRAYAVANSANDNGIIVGTAADTFFGANRLPVMWQNGAVTQLTLPDGETIGDATGVNSAGIIVGSVDGGSLQRGAIYKGPASAIIKETTSTGCFFITAFGINNSARIVGFGIDPGNAARNVGIVLDFGSTSAFEVGAIPGANGAIAFAVSNAGHIVGSSMMNQGSGTPFIYTDQVGIRAIPFATGTSQGSARGVNSAGWVVGDDSNAFSIPFLWDGTTTYRIADLLPANSGWDLDMNTSSSALGISDDGVIVGTGVHNGETHAYAMVPVQTTPTPTPGPATHFSVTAPANVVSGDAFSFSVTALDSTNNVATGYTGTVHFSSSDPSAILPANSTLTNGAGTFQATLHQLPSQTITATDTVNATITGTSNSIVVIIGDPTPSPTPSGTPSSPTPTPTATPSPGTPTATPTPIPPPGQSLNVSTRLFVQGGDNVGIGGFIITGTTPVRVLLRGIGPSLIGAGVPDALPDPTLDLRDSSGAPILFNNNWRDTQEAEIFATGIPPTNDLEAAIIQTLAPGSYTVILAGSGTANGVGLVEIYDLDHGMESKLANLATRAFVETGSNVLIAGFILGGNNGNDRIVVRGIGPSLTAAGVPNALANPTLELRDMNGTRLIQDDDWQDDPAQTQEIIASGLAPTNDLESAVAVTLAPGPYTAIVSGVENGTGVGLVEVYDRGGAPIYQQTNLVSDQAGQAAFTDSNLKNPWGIATSSTSPFWVADNMTGLSTLYNTTGQPSALVVTVPPASGGKTGNPTGIVYNGTSDFEVGTSAPARFIFATEDGTISGWSQAIGSTAVLKVDNSASTAVYKGLAIGNNGTGNFLYAANFHAGRIDVFDASYTSATLAGNFIDPNIPSGYAPFNIQNIGNVLYVAYALQDAEGVDDVPGLGHGYISTFDLNGNFVARFASQGTLNSPWGMAIAPNGFGAFTGNLLVGNFGDGRINVFDPDTHAYLGQLSDATSTPISIEGLWGLIAGNGGSGGEADAIYFAAGVALEEHGLFGSLKAQ